MRFVLLTILFVFTYVFINTASFAGATSVGAVSTEAVSTGAVSTAADSLIIQGRILNLNGRLYRQAPVITFSRNNILQPQLELSKQAPLAADGSFRVSLPMLYQKEEIYLDYSGKAFTTFLGSPGTIEITFDGDSLVKAKRLFYFSGVNADANNQYYSFLAEENKRLASSPELGPRFYDTFWEKSPEEAQSFAKKRAELRISALSKVASTNIIDPSLRQWASSLSDDEMYQNLFEYALSNRYALGKDLLDSLVRLSKSPLTAQRVTWANRFGNYADQKVVEKKYANPNRNHSLPVRLMAAMIRNNSSRLTADEIARLDEITEKGIAEKSELDFLNKLYAKNEAILNLLFDFERESRIYGDLFDSTARELLKARYLPKNFYRYNYKEQAVLGKYIQTRLSSAQFRQSLDEIVKIELKDSADIKKIIAFNNVRPEPTEALPGYYLSTSNERGTSWLNKILEKYKGRTIYLSKWNLEDDKSREEMEYMMTLQAQLPEDIVFVFLHLPGTERIVSIDLVKQYIVRHRLKGIHLSLNENQVMDLLFKLNPIEPGTFSIFRPNGKSFSKNAPGPSSTEKAVQAVLEAQSK